MRRVAGLAAVAALLGLGAAWYALPGSTQVSRLDPASNDTAPADDTEADGPLRIAIVLAPQDAALQGARLGAREAEQTARLLGAEFVVIEALAEYGSATVVARELLREHAVAAIVGGSTAADADALADLAARHALLFLNVGAPREELRNACAAGVLHVAPSAAMKAAAVRLAQPAAPDARAVSWHPDLQRFGAGQVSDRYEAMTGHRMVERAWEGWFAVKLLLDASQRARTARGAGLADYLTSPRAAFDGHKGVQLSFHPAARQLRQPLYVTAGAGIIAELPDLRTGRDLTHAELLDALDTTGGGTCGS